MTWVKHFHTIALAYSYRVHDKKNEKDHVSSIRIVAQQITQKIQEQTDKT
jgi:hypothetical protein